MIIYVALLDEGVKCWRPVEAIHQGSNVYKIVGFKPDDENWQFNKNDLVICKRHIFQDNEVALVAYAKAE